MKKSFLSYYLLIFSHKGKRSGSLSTTPCFLFPTDFPQPLVSKSTKPTYNTKSIVRKFITLSYNYIITHLTGFVNRNIKYFSFNLFPQRFYKFCNITLIHKIKIVVSDKLFCVTLIRLCKICGRYTF